MKKPKQFNSGKAAFRRALTLCVVIMTTLFSALPVNYAVLAGDTAGTTDSSILNAESAAQTENQSMPELSAEPSPAVEEEEDGVKDEDNGAEETIVEDGVYAALVTRETVSDSEVKLYVTVRMEKITALRTIVAEDTGMQQETWDEVAKITEQQCAGMSASAELIQGQPYELRAYTPEQREYALLLWESISRALSGDKLSPEDEEICLQQIRTLDARAAEAATADEERTELQEKTESADMEGSEAQEKAESAGEEGSETQEKTESAGKESPEVQRETESADTEESQVQRLEENKDIEDEDTDRENTKETEESGEGGKVQFRAVRGPRRVSGSQIAADGTYAATVTVTKTKKNKKYYGTVYVTVSDGVISNLYIYAADKQKRFTALLDSVYANYIGKPAAANTGVDAVTSASLGGTGSSSSEYTSDLVQAIQAALAGAPAASGNSVAAVADGVYTGTGHMTGNDHYVTLQVAVKDGVITSLIITDADGSWDNLLGQVSGAYIDNVANAETVDAVTSATPQGYREAIANAIKDALGGTATEPAGGGEEGTQTDPLEGNNLRLSAGDKYVLSAGTEYSSFYTYTWSTGNTAKVRVEPISGTNQAVVTALEVTTAPVTVQCTYGFGYPLNVEQTFYVTVVEPEPDENDPETVVYPWGTVKTETGRVFDGPVIVEDGAEVTFESCTFRSGIQAETPDAVVILKNCTLLLDEQTGLLISDNEIARTETARTLTEEDRTILVFPKLQGELPDNSSLVVKPDWAAGQASSEGVFITGITPEEPCIQTFAANLSYRNLSAQVPMVLYVEESPPPMSGIKDSREPFALGMVLAAAVLAAWEILCRRNRRRIRS